MQTSFMLQKFTYLNILNFVGKNYIVTLVVLDCIPSQFLQHCSQSKFGSFFFSLFFIFLTSRLFRLFLHYGGFRRFTFLF